MPNKAPEIKFENNYPTYLGYEHLYQLIEKLKKLHYTYTEPDYVLIYLGNHGGDV